MAHSLVRLNDILKFKVKLLDFSNTINATHNDLVDMSVYHQVPLLPNGIFDRCPDRFRDHICVKSHKKFLRSVRCHREQLLEKELKGKLACGIFRNCRLGLSRAGIVACTLSM